MNVRLRNPIRTRATCVLLAASLCLAPLSSCGIEEDYQRDILVSVGGGLASAILTNTLLGPGDSDAAVRAVPGPQGPQGDPGPSFFNVFVDKFYGAQFDSGFRIVPVANDVPFLGANAGPVAYRFLVPATVDTQSSSLNPITMRLYLNRSGPCNGGCLVFTIDARRLRDGDSAPQCYGGSAGDCSDGTRWIMVHSVCPDGADSAEMLYAIDLPLMAGGLEYPTVAAGDYLAFELNTLMDDGGNHRLLGVEFFDSTTAELMNAIVLFSEDSIPDDCEPVERPIPDDDCNDNGIPDAIDIADGTSEDCNSNTIPDECDIAYGISEDVNGNGVPDECDPDCNDNGTPDDQDITDGTSQDCNGNDIPDECDVADGTSDDANGNGVPDECDPDCNDNGVPDDIDIAEGTSQDCNNNDVPDECDIADGTSDDANGNGVPDECDEDCNGNGIPDDIDIAQGTSQDCNNNDVPDECDIADGTSDDANGNGVPDECDPDCNENGVPDDLDIARGTSQDCNNNDIPDECDIADGTSDDANGNGVPDECDPDCNENGVPDDLDIANGTSQDCNHNDIPDECDIADGTSADLNGNGIPDECDPDCNNNGIPDDLDISQGTSEDCNGNDVPDVCDIIENTSPDCDGNGVPDECDNPIFCINGRVKPRALTLRYTGEDCSASNHSQDPCQIYCEGDPALASLVRIVANDKPAPFHQQAATWFDGTVELDGTFRIDAARAGELRLSGSTWVHILDASDAVLQTVQIHTSCSQPLNAGDQFASIVVLNFTPEDCDDLCAGFARPQVLTMEYTGEDCSAMHHSQDPSMVICNGDPALTATVRILSSNDPDPFNTGAFVWFDGTVELNGTFDIDATSGGMTRLTGETWVHILTPDDAVLQSVRFHTSCSQPLYLDDQFGSVVLRAFVAE